MRVKKKKKKLSKLKEISRVQTMVFLDMVGVGLSKERKIESFYLRILVYLVIYDSG